MLWITAAWVIAAVADYFAFRRLFAVMKHPREPVRQDREPFALYHHRHESIAGLVLGARENEASTLLYKLSLKPSARVEPD